MTPRAYGEQLADERPSLTPEQVEAAARAWVATPQPPPARCLPRQPRGRV